MLGERRDADGDEREADGHPDMDEASEQMSAEERARRRERYRGRPAPRGRTPRREGGGMLDRFRDMSPAARWGLGVPLFLLAFGVIAVVGDLLVSAGRIHPGVSVAGVSVGGQTREQAASRLGTDLLRRLSEPVTVRYREKTWSVDAARVGATLDSTLTADAAYAVGREPQLGAAAARRLKATFGGVEVTGTVEADDLAMAAFLDVIDQDVAVPARDATVTLTGLEPTLVPAADGARLARHKAAADILQALLSQQRNVQVGLEKVPVRVTDAEARDAIEQTKKLLSGPVTILWEGKSWTFQPKDVASWITYVQVIEGTTTPADEATGSAGVSVAASGTAKPTSVTLLATFDPAAVSRTLTPLTGVIGRPAVNAEFVVQGGSVSIKAGQTGLGPDVASLVTDMERTLKGKGPREVTLKLSSVEPELTTEEAKAMGIKERLVFYTTTYNATQANRVNNIHVLANALTNKLIPPGGVFDFNATVGERTAAKGYAIAPGIVNGKLVPQYGGGICQIGTTYFNAVFFAGLPVVERKNHSFYISHYPKGRDATVTWNGPNLRWQNDTGNWILVKVTYTAATVTVSLYGTSPGYSVTYTTSDWSNIRPKPIVEQPDPTLPAGVRVVADPGEDGKTCTVVRTVTKGGAVVRTDTFVSNYKPKEETVRVGTKVVPSTPTSPTP